MPSTNASARRNTAEIIASAKRHLKYLTGLWSVRSEVYEPHPDGPGLMGDYRPRRDDEYPENQPNVWATTAIQLDKLIHELTVLRDYAEDNADGYRAAIINHRKHLTAEES